MINNSMFLLLMIVHLLGDFYLQVDSLVCENEIKIGAVLRHSIIYCVPYILFVLVWNKTIIVYLIAHIIIHFLIDLSMFGLIRIKKINKRISLCYIVDQFLHLLVIIVISYIFVQTNVGNIKLLPSISRLIVNLYGADKFEFVNFLKMLLLGLIILKPTGITFNIVFAKVKPKKEDEKVENEKEINYGKIIGYLERVLIVALLTIKQYEVIGWIIAGKSLARLNGNVRAEYYIIGTFYSIAVAIISFLLIWNI